MKKYEVTVSIRLHGSFTVEAENEREAEDIIKRKFEEGEIVCDDLEFADERCIDCVGEAADGYVCPLSQRPCDGDCSRSEKANCEHHQSLSDGR